MSLLQKVGCCSCSVPELPCNNCNTNRCTCGPSEAQPQTTPVTSVHIEISEMSTSRFSADIEDRSAWHYRANKSWRNTEMGVKFNRLMSKINRLVLTAEAYTQGRRFGDHLPVPSINGFLYPLSIPAGRWGNYPSQGLNSLKAVCGPCTKTGLCGDDLVICCRCNEPGSTHGCFVDTEFNCLKSQGAVQGPYDGGPTSEACFTCTDSCNGWSSGIVGVVRRSYNLVKDTFFRGGGNLFRTVFGDKLVTTKDPVKRAQKFNRRRLVESAVETSDDPQIFTEEQTLEIVKSEGELERVEKRFRYPITTTVEHEGEILELSGGMGSGFGDGPGGGGGGGEPVDCSLDPGATCVTGVGCPPGCMCVAGNCVPSPDPVTCQTHCGRFNSCTEEGEWYDKFAGALDQSKSGVWNYISARNDCCSAAYAGTSITVEMDWPCEETANAYIRARQKYEFGLAAFEEAKRYCSEEGQGTLDCGNAPDTVKPECCNPLAQEKIGAFPPTTIPCIKHCPNQATCDDDYVRWPQGDKQPLGENVEQSISCMGGVEIKEIFDPDEDWTPSIETPDDVAPAILTPTGSSPCTFQTQSVDRNWASYCNGGHQCGDLTCPPQFCCHEADCYNSNCCEQILDYNPNTGEPVTDEERLYLGPDNELCPWGLADDGNGNIGGWSAIPDADGVYHRCKRPLADCDYVSGDETVTIKGC